ncbi:MAG: tetratricopeptide repeat protein [Candidatus Heimdallarchaeota archaeon]|nr:tetratricopeptide repeat protein [Candidatus Heimdallarchaeota archaeon]
MPKITIESEGSFEVKFGQRLVLAIEEAGIDILHRCGSYAACTTCRVEFLEGEPQLMTEAEQNIIRKRIEMGDEQIVNARLSCQIYVEQDMHIKVLQRLRDSRQSSPGRTPKPHVTPEPRWIGDETMTFFENRVTVANELGNLNIRANALSGLGLKLYDQHKFKKAKSKFLEAEAIFLELKDQAGLAKVKNLLANTYWFEGQLDKSIELRKSTLAIYSDLNNLNQYAGVLEQIAFDHNQINEYDIAQTYFLKAKEIYEQLNSSFGIATAIKDVALTHRFKDEYDEALKFLVESKSIFQTNNRQEEVAKILQHIGHVYVLKGDFERALSNYLEGMEILKQLNSKFYLSRIASAVGKAFSLKGELNQALDYYNEAITIIDEMEMNSPVYEQINPLIGIGNVHSIQGELDLAIGNYNRAQLISEEIQWKFGEIDALNGLGDAYFKKRELGKSITYLTRALEKRQEIGDKLDIAESLFTLIVVFVERNNRDKAKEILKNLSQINNELTSKQVNLKSRLAEGIVLKGSNRMKDKMKAQQIYEDILSEEVFDHTLIVLTLLNLCEILIIELQSLQDKEVLEEINQLVNRLHEIAKLQQSYQLLTEVHIIKSRLALIDNQVDEAVALLDEVLTLVEAKNLDYLSTKITSQRVFIMSQIETWSDLASQNVSLRKMIEQTQLQDYIKTSQQIVRFEEQIQESKDKPYSVTGRQ